MGPFKFTPSDGGYAVHTGGKFIGCAFRLSDGWIGEPAVFDTETKRWMVSWADRVGPFKTRKEAAEALHKIKEGEGVTA